MAESLQIQGRAWSFEQIDQIRQWVLEHPGWSRYRLSRQLCVRWPWVRPNGQLADMAARGFLSKLHQRGLVELPPLRRASPNRMKHRRLDYVALDTGPSPRTATPPPRKATPPPDGPAPCSAGTAGSPQRDFDSPGNARWPARSQKPTVGPDPGSLHRAGGVGASATPRPRQWSPRPRTAGAGASSGWDWPAAAGARG